MPTMQCLQYPANCPHLRAERCIGGCGDDDEVDGGGTIIPPSPPSPTPFLPPSSSNPAQPPTFYPTPPPPDGCAILATCSCTSNATDTVATCAGAGFDDANSSDTQTLPWVVAGPCSIGGDYLREERLAVGIGDWDDGTLMIWIDGIYYEVTFRSGCHRGSREIGTRITIDLAALPSNHVSNPVYLRMPWCGLPIAFSLLGVGGLLLLGSHIGPRGPPSAGFGGPII